jgi:NADP-dependent 3-hydroxy acid dehydrogenase YdfG
MLAPKDVLLEGRVVLVTGAAVGLGEVIALAFARFGADVAIRDRDAENLADTAKAVRAAGRRSVTGTTLHVDGGNLAAAGWRRGPDGGLEA